MPPTLLSNNTQGPSRMHVIVARNANQALPEALHQLAVCGVRSDSRNGPVLRFPGPTAIVVREPTERVVFWQARDANPFFHLLEAIWMLGGRDDVAFPSSILSSISQFSDDGLSFNGAYGKRWRTWFGRDQVVGIAQALKADPTCRRQVMTMWDGHHDPEKAETGSKDVPCNTHIYFSRDLNGLLHMTVCNRSNDLVWGALGANTVHFSVLQEYMAAIIGCEVGTYTQFSNNMHLYLNQHQGLIDQLAPFASEFVTGKNRRLSPKYTVLCPYELGAAKPYPLASRVTTAELDADINMLLDERFLPLGGSSAFMRKVAAPLLAATDYLKSDASADRYEKTRGILAAMPPCDWKQAADFWLLRREKRQKDKTHANPA